MPQSYKIFIKDIPLIISSEINDIDSNAIYLEEAIVNQDFIDFILLEIKMKKPHAFFMKSGDALITYNHLKEVLKLVVSAGGIVWNKQQELLMIFRRGKWDLPKGKVELGETLETAAIREVEEESGVGKLRILEKFEVTYHIYKEYNEWIIKETHWFEMLSADDGETIPQISEGITFVKWIPKDAIQSRLKYTYSSIKSLIEKNLMCGYFFDHN